MKRAIFAMVLCACTSTYKYDPADVGDQEGSAREPRGKTSTQFLRGAYADLLGRSPENYTFTLTVDGAQAFQIPLDEERTLGDALDAFGDSTPARAVIVNGMLH